MLNKDGNDVPDKTIAIFLDRLKGELPYEFSKERVPNVVSRLTKTRDWFDSYFYKCLPLTIGNTYGFVVTSEFDFAFEWNGGPSYKDIVFYWDQPQEEVAKLAPLIESHFGHGVITVDLPLTFRTPPGVNLMTINPPNVIIPNITVLTGVVEADNLRRNFTFNLKIQIPNIKVHVPKGTPLAGFLPIPRYYADSFSLVMADEIFTKEVIDEEVKARADAHAYRNNVEPKLKSKVSRHYYKGVDVYGNKFTDHQSK